MEEQRAAEAAGPEVSGWFSVRVALSNEMDFLRVKGGGRRGGVLFTPEVPVKMLYASHGTRWLSRFNVVVIYQMCKTNLSLSVIRQVPVFPFLSRF